MKQPHKIVPIDQAATLIRAAQCEGQSVVMCHGCFDIVHPGHIRHLQHAARLGDRLIVTVSGDATVAMKSHDRGAASVGGGAARPLIPQELRAENLAALDCVDWVAINHEPTAAEILEILQPDVYVKGREYEHNHDPRFLREKAIVERHGGRIVFTSGDVIFSSTALIAAMEQSANPIQASLKSLLEHHEFRSPSMEGVIDRFRGQRVLVVGEAIRDTYVMCARPAIAGEGPIMTLRPLEHRGFDGGAAIVARHIAAMGGHATLLTALPRSTEAEALRRRLLVEGVNVQWIDNDSPLIEKQRFLVGATKVMKLDVGGPLTLDATDQDAIIGLAGEIVTECDAAIVCDFGQGLFTAAMLTRLCEALRDRVSVLSGDVSGRRSNLLAMRNMDLLCPSEAEVRDALHDYDEGLSSVVWRVLDQTESRAAIATLGEEGLIAFSRRPDATNNPEQWQPRLDAEHVPALSTHAIDQLGCGDALLAAATLAITAGGTLVQAALLGSIAAAFEAQRLGNAVISAADLRAGARRLNDAQPAGLDNPIHIEVQGLEPAHAQLRPAHAQST